MSNAKPAQSVAARDKAALEKSIDNIDWRIKELRAFDASRIQERWDPRLEALQEKVNTTLADILGTRTSEYKQHAIGALDAALDSTFGDRFSPDELRQTIEDAIKLAIGKLNAVKKLLAERGGPTAQSGTEQDTTAAPTPAPTPA
ncbi:MAG: hypothetical protein NDJ19_14210, partial [Ramlibacter sp.]|nr:hypothetical protein [Ramlibacter sp.]